MNENPTASDWAAERGEKWLSQLAGMEAMIACVDEPLIAALQLDAPCRIADIGCGGGGATFDILRHALTGSIVHGFDISPALIKSARASIPSGERNIAFELADVSTAPAPKEPYDRLVSRFGVMFFEDPRAAFANLTRWLAPEGRFAFAVWGLPADNPWMKVVREVVVSFIDVPRPDIEAPGPFRYGEVDKLLTLLSDAGFSNIEVQDWRGQLPVGGGLPAAEAADFSLASYSAIAELMAEAGEGVRNQVRDTLIERFSEHESDGKVYMDASVHIVTGGVKS
ncbi:MAG: methyltransferase domain-containing protein [Acidobacteriota bacterium]